jgi:hypothetical protein
MLTKLRRLFNYFFNRSRTINNEPINKVSLIVIILIDWFILGNVFTGLNDISRWHLSPDEAYPCYAEWQNYHTQTAKDKDYAIVQLALQNANIDPVRVSPPDQPIKASRLDKVSEICLKYAETKAQITTPEQQQTLKTITQKQTQISALEQKNRTIRSQYESALLEKIADQPANQSPNLVKAEQTKQKLEENNQQITARKTEIATLKTTLVEKSVAFLTFLKDENQRQAVAQGHQQSSFWYPSMQLALQTLFLLPLILIALTVHLLAQRRNYGLISLISWHLLVIFCIPLILKIFEFLQIGVIFKFLFDIVSKLLGRLLFLISYVYILLIPLIGFGLIKFFQSILFNPKAQVANRVQKLLCLRCTKKLQRQDPYCPHCGYQQYQECPNCHQPTHRHLPYCKQCGNEF